MKSVKIGVSACRGMSPLTLEKADYIEIKKITEEEVAYFMRLTEKPILFHLQYSGDNSYYLPAAFDLKDRLAEISPAYEEAKPRLTSLHFGLSARSMSIDTESYMAVALSGLLTKEEIVTNLEKNLKTFKNRFPETKLLVENVEFIPEALSKGAYRYVQEADFFTSHVKKWHKMGILDGIVFDVAHGLITAGNHPSYNGLTALPLNTGVDYVARLKKRNDLFEYFKIYISQMPLTLIREIHISGITRLSNGVWVDSHMIIGEKELTGLEILLNSLHDNSEKYIPITLEYSRDMDKITYQLDTLRNFCNAEQ